MGSEKQVSVSLCSSCNECIVQHNRQKVIAIFCRKKRLLLGQ